MGDQSLQRAEYAFPYHHLPAQAGRRVHLGRAFRGGAEYLAYTQLLVDRVVALQPRSVLDVGCGDARLLAELGLVTDAELSGIDIDHRALAFAAAFLDGPHLADLAVEQVDRAFDLVLCIETLEHIGDQEVEGFLASTWERVAPAGHLVICVPSTARSVSAKHHRHYDLGSLRATIEASCASAHIVELVEVVPSRRWLDYALRLLVNRSYTLDIGWLNAAVLALHLRPVGRARRGDHVVAVARRSPP